MMQNKFLEDLGDILAQYHSEHYLDATSKTGYEDRAAQIFARYLRASRSCAGLSIEELAEKAHMPEAKIFALERGLILSTNIRPNILSQLADALNEDVTDLMLMLGREIPRRRPIIEKIVDYWRAAIAYLGSSRKVLIVLGLMVVALTASFYFIGNDQHSWIPAFIDVDQGGLSAPAFNGLSHFTTQLLYILSTRGLQLSIVVLLSLLIIWVAIWRGDIPLLLAPYMGVWQRRLVYVTPLITVFVIVITGNSIYFGGPDQTQLLTSQISPQLSKDPVSAVQLSAQSLPRGTNPRPYVSEAGFALAQSLRTSLDVTKNESIPPDLVIHNVHPASNSIRVNIRNVKAVDAVNDFWVDLYIDPKVNPEVTKIARLNNNGLHNRTVLVAQKLDLELNDEILQLISNSEQLDNNSNFIALLLVDGYDKNDSYLYRFKKKNGGRASTEDNLAFSHTGRAILSYVGHGSGWHPELIVYSGQPGNQAIGGMLWDHQPFASQNWSWTSVHYDEDNLDTVADVSKGWLKNEVSELYSYENGSLSTYPFTYSLIDLHRLDEVYGSMNTVAQALIVKLSEKDTRFSSVSTHNTRYNINLHYWGSKETPWLDILFAITRSVLMVALFSIIGMVVVREGKIRLALTEIPKAKLPWSIPH